MTRPRKNLVVVGHRGWGELADSQPVERRQRVLSKCKPGQWAAGAEVGWTPTERRLSFAAMPLVPFSIWLSFTQDLRLYGLFSLYYLACFWMGTLLQPAHPLNREQPLNDDEVAAQIRISESLTTLGMDSGILWFQDDRLYFSGLACSFILSRADIRWNGLYDDEDFTAGRADLPLKGSEFFLSINCDSSFDLASKLLSLKKSKDHSTDERQLPPTTRQPGLVTLLPLSNAHSWIPFLPQDPKQYPLGGVMLVALLGIGCVGAMIPDLQISPGLLPLVVSPIVLGITLYLIYQGRLQREARWG